MTAARPAPVAARRHPLTESRGHHTPFHRGANNGSMSRELHPPTPPSTKTTPKPQRLTTPDKYPETL